MRAWQVRFTSSVQNPVAKARAVHISQSRILEPAMTSAMSYWTLYRVWLSSRYPVWLAYGGLIAAMTLIFAVVSH